MIPERLLPTRADHFRESATLATHTTSGVVTLNRTFAPPAYVRATSTDLIAQVSVLITGNVSDLLVLPAAAKSVVRSVEVFGTVTSLTMPVITTGSLTVTSVSETNAPVSSRQLIQAAVRGYLNPGRRTAAQVDPTPVGLTALDRPEFYTNVQTILVGDLLRITGVWHRVETASPLYAPQGIDHMELVLTRLG